MTASVQQQGGATGCGTRAKPCQRFVIELPDDPEERGRLYRRWRFKNVMLGVVTVVAYVVLIVFVALCVLACESCVEL